VPHRLRTLLAAIAGALVLGGGGVAAAAGWPAAESAESAAPGTAPALTVTAAPAVAALYPRPATGYPSDAVGTVAASVRNSGPATVRLTTAALGAITVSPLPGRTCAAGNVVPTRPGPVRLPTPVDVPPAGRGTVTVTVPGALEMVTDADPGCAGATITALVTLTGTPV
jgi:hypothetical protein